MKFFKMIKQMAAISLVGLCAASYANSTYYYNNPSFSSNADIYTPTHFYLGANVGVLKIETISAELNKLQSKYPLTYSGNAGFQFTRHLALEGGYAYSTISTSDVTDGSGNEQATFSYPYIASKVDFLASRVNIYAKLGMAYVKITSKTDPSANVKGEPIPYLGVGADINIMRNLALNVDLSGPTFGVVGFYDLSAGIALKF